MLIWSQIWVLKKLKHVKWISPDWLQQVINKARLIFHNILNNLFNIVLNSLYICLDPSIWVHQHSRLDQTIQVKQSIDRSNTLSSGREHIGNNLSKYVVEHIRHNDLELLLFMKFIKIVNILLDLILTWLLLDYTWVFRFGVLRWEIRVLE